MSLLATPDETGYFSASFRVVEAILLVAGLVTASAFPVVARAAHDDRTRFGYSMQRLFEVGVILGVWTTVCVVLGAKPAMGIVGGSEFEDAAPVLRVQGLALASSFLVAIWATGLWSMRRQHALAWANLVGVALAVGLTALLIPDYGAIGAAVAMIVAESVLAAMYAVALMRGNAHLRPTLSVVPKTALAGVAGLALWFAPVADVAKVVIATCVFFGVLVVLKAIPGELTTAVVERWRAPRGGQR
jgi:O-antigen/teichoic acid export membrane protein